MSCCTFLSSRTELCVRNLFLVQTRGKKFVPRNPPDPHFEKKLMLEVCKPIYDPAPKTSWETCALNVLLPKSLDAHPYEKILCNELKNNLEASRMVCFFHVNPMSMEEERKVKVIFRKKDMYLHIYKEGVTKMAFQNTAFEPCLHLFKSKSAILFSSEPKAGDVLKESKKTAQVLLLGGIIDNVFFSKTQLQEYSKLPSKDVMHQNLCGLIQTKLADISRTLSQPSQLLSMSLKQHSSVET